MTNERVRLRFVAPLRRKRPPAPLAGEIAFLPMEAIGDDGTYDQDSVCAAEEVGDGGFTYFEQGDVVRARVTPCFENGKGALLSTLIGQRGLGTTELFVFKHSSCIDARFLYYLTISQDFTGNGTATIYGAHGVRRVDDQFVRDYRAWLPPLPAQRAIVDYLDRETARIDGLIAAKRRTIDEFDERFQSALELSLLGDGLAEIGSRWYPWLGSNRSLWRLKYLTDKIGSGKTPAGGGESYVDEGVIFLRSQNILVGSLDLADVAHVSQAVDSDMRSTRVLPGDVLLNITGASLGRCCVASDDITPANVNQHVCIVRPHSGVSGPMLHYAIRARLVQEQIRQEQVGGNRDGLNFEQVGNLEVCLPQSVTAQHELAMQLKRTEEEQRRAIAMLRDQILLLAERRQALITAAVTGQLDIPEAA
jgi:type I restriction enzyme S subunit